MEVQHHLMDHLFHGVCKHICDSLWYLYSVPGSSYLQLMVATRKAESENKKTQEKVRARAAVTSDLGEGIAELSQQIVKLMDTLTQTGQDSGSTSAPGSPQDVAMDRGMVVGEPPVAQSPAMAGAVLARQPQPAAYPQNRGRRHGELGQ